MQMQEFERIYEALGEHTLPRWEELPDFELYMDQVLSLVGRYLRKRPDSEERPLTSSMVNNYVKLKVLPPPVSKRYSRTHIARLLMICTLKSVIPISSIQKLLPEEEQMEAFYDRFCALYGQTNRELAASVPAESSLMASGSSLHAHKRIDWHPAHRAVPNTLL